LFSQLLCLCYQQFAYNPRARAAPMAKRWPDEYECAQR
jgi:hypothetical protein